VTKSGLDELSDDYESAETQFLAAVRDNADRSQLAVKARAVATAANLFNAEAHRRFHSGVEDAWMPLDQLTERTEVLADLWEDIARAYEMNKNSAPSG
jgi:hypothetical protein